MDSERRKALLTRREEFQRKLHQQRQRESCQDLLAQLDAISATYEIIWTDTKLFNPATHWLTENFPIAWWGRVDWQKVDGYIQEFGLISNYEKLVQKFKQIILDQKLENPNVIIIWSDANTLSLELSLSIVSEYAELIFQQSWDTWIICPQHHWCIEYYHEGELTFGYSPHSVLSPEEPLR